jgi:hypothetical protein
VKHPLASLAVALLAGATAAGCTASPARPPSAAPPRTVATALAAQPFPGAAGARDRVVVRAQGTGPRTLASFVVDGSSLYFEISCLGSGNFTVADRTPMFVVGPCDGSGTTSTVGGEKGRLLRLSVDVAPSTRWELYLTEG